MQELTTKDFIAQSLVKFQAVTTAEQIEAAKPELMALKIENINDHAGYKTVHEKLNKLVKVRTGIDAKRKELLVVSKTYEAAVNGEAKRLTDLAAPIEAHLRAQKTAIDAERERLANEQRLREEAERRAAVERLNKRTNQLFEYGAMFNGTAYVLDGRPYRLGMSEIGQDQISHLDDMAFEQFLKTVAELRRLIDVEIAKFTPPAPPVVEPAPITVPPAPVADLFSQASNLGKVGEASNVRVENDSVKFDVQFNDKQPASPQYYNPQQVGYNQALDDIINILNGEQKFTRTELKDKINSLRKFA